MLWPSKHMSVMSRKWRKRIMENVNQQTEEVAVEVVDTNSIEQAERAAVDVQIATAKKWPMHSDKRQIETVKTQILELATMDEETAESCFYVLPRAGKKIPGASASRSSWA